jgi:hypothetical protein
MVGHRPQPDVGVEPDLVAGMTGQHRTATGLRHVADQEPGPAGLGASFGQALDVFYQARMPPIAVAREPHDLPGGAIDRQRLGAGEAAFGIEAEHLRLELRWRGLAAEQFLGRIVGIVGLGERGQRLGLEGAQILRARDLRAGELGEQRKCDGSDHPPAIAGALPRFNR